MPDITPRAFHRDERLAKPAANPVRRKCSGTSFADAEGIGGGTIIITLTLVRVRVTNERAAGRNTAGTRRTLGPGGTRVPLGSGITLSTAVALVTLGAETAGWSTGASLAPFAALAALVPTALATVLARRLAALGRDLPQSEGGQEGGADGAEGADDLPATGGRRRQNRQGDFATWVLHGGTPSARDN
jgi:hypothetical protein